MNRNFLLFAIFFSVLLAVCGLLQSIIYFLINGQMYGHESFAHWLLAVNATTLVTSLFFLKYYHHKKYWFTFSASTFHIIANLFLFAVFYYMLNTGGGNKLYIPAVITSIAAGVVYALSLIFSPARERVWLKAAGIAMLIFSIIQLSDGILYLNSQDTQVKGNLDKIRLWVTLLGGFIPVLLILNFVRELSDLNRQNIYTRPHKYLYKVLGVLATIAVASTMLFGVLLAHQAFSTVYWGDRNFEKTREMARLFEARTFVSNKGEKLRYRLLKPLDYDPQKKYPLVVCLPYGGQPPTDTIRQIEGAAAAEILSSDHNRRRYPAFLFVPNIPAGAGWGGIPNYPTVDTLVFEAISALQQQEAGIDVTRCYITGISRGGYGSWHFITSRPDMFAAAIPVCGGGNPRLAPNIVDVDVWAFHGEKDRNVPVSGSRDMISAIKKAGGYPRYTEYKGEGHNIWYQVSETPGLWDWLFAQKKN